LGEMIFRDYTNKKRKKVWGCTTIQRITC
jgi:hypothetical protein